MTKEEMKTQESDEQEVKFMEEFTLGDDYEVLRREFVSHVFDAACTFRSDSISFNSAAINKIEDKDYINILINRDKKVMIVRACHQDDPDSIRWCSRRKDSGKRVSKKITCRTFASMMYDMMGWARENRYKIQATIIRTEDEILLVFNLRNVEIYIPKIIVNEGTINNKMPFFPSDWKGSFGLPFNEHEKIVKVDLLDGFAKMEVVTKKIVKAPRKVKNYDRIDPSATSLEDVIKKIEKEK